MAYDASVPGAAADKWSEDLAAMQANFVSLRQFFMSGAAPVDGATMAYSYNASGELTALTFGGTLTGSAAFSYTSGELRTETWSIYGKTITITHTYSSGNLTGSSTAIT